MGSSSKTKGKGQPQAAKAPTGKVSNGLGGTNAFYEPGQALPAAGGLVRPDAIPGQPQGIGLNYVVPSSQPRQQLAQVIQRPRRRAEGWGGEGGSSSWGNGRGEHASGGKGFW